MCFVFATCCFLYFLPHYGNEERADLTTEQPDELHFHGLSRLLVTSHCLFSFSVYLVKNCDNKKRLLLSSFMVFQSFAVFSRTHQILHILSIQESM